MSSIQDMADKLADDVLEKALAVKRGEVAETPAAPQAQDPKRRTGH